jgi:hypothetical protein
VVNIDRASLASISIGQVGIGPIQIGQLVLDNTDFSMSAALGVLRNMSVTVTLRITLSWHIHIGMPWPFDDIDFGDSYDLGSPSFSMGVGDVTIPGLSNVHIQIPSLTASNVAATSVQPLTNLQLGNAVAEQIVARNVVLPSAGFTIAGLTLTSVQGSTISVPAASVGEVTIGRVHGDPVNIGSFSLGGLSMPSASIPDIVSQAPLNIPANLQARTFSMPAGILTLSLTIRPSALSHIDQLRITNTHASASVGQIVLHNVTLPYDVLNLRLAQIGINTIGIPAFSVS